MSEYITHIGVLDDTARLALHSDEICDAFKLCFTDYHTVARMGSSSRGNNTYIVQNLDYFRDIWKNRKPEDRLEEKLAYTLGWITHRSADKYVKATNESFDDNPENSHPNDIRILHDVIIYEKVYNNGQEDPFTEGFMEQNMESHPASHSMNVRMAEFLFTHVYQSELMELQSFKDVNDGEAFMARLFDQFAELTVDFDRHINAYENPNETLREKLIQEPNFYQDSDPIIKLARALQHNQTLPDVSLSEALKAEDQSRYAEILIKTYRWIREGSRYFTREIDVDKKHMFDFYQIWEGNIVERY